MSEGGGNGLQAAIDKLILELRGDAKDVSAKLDSQAKEWSKKLDSLRGHVDDQGRRAEEREERRLQELEKRQGQSNAELRGDFTRLAEKIAEDRAYKEVLEKCVLALGSVAEFAKKLGSIAIQQQHNTDKLKTLERLTWLIIPALVAAGIATLWFKGP